MNRLLILSTLLLVSCLASPAQAQDYTPPDMGDPLVLRLLCDSTPEHTTSGPGYSQASIFSLHEKGGERLYVGFVRDLRSADSRQAFWRGPVATYWEGLRPVPEHKSLLTAPNPARYRIDRLTRLPDGRLEKAVMEIDLDAQPPQLRLVGGGAGQPKHLDSKPLGEELPMSGALKLLTRMRQQATADTRVLGLRAYGIVLGDEKGVVAPPYWGKDSSKSPYLLAVCNKDDLPQSALHFLPQRINGWKFDSLLHMPERGDVNGTFSVRMFSLYWGPSASGPEAVLGSRSFVGVSLRGKKIRLISDQLEDDPEAGEWSRPEPCVKSTRRPKP
jgi:hypothetical protein